MGKGLRLPVRFSKKEIIKNESKPYSEAHESTTSFQQKLVLEGTNFSTYSLRSRFVMEEGGYKSNEDRHFFHNQMFNKIHI